MVGTVGAAQPANVVLAPASDGQAMPWRLNAANSAPPWGVPSVRLPLSSSTARMTFHIEPVLQPSEVQVPPLVLQVKPCVPVERDRYQRRSVIVQADPVPGLGRSRLAKSHSDSEVMYDSQCPSRLLAVTPREIASLPHGPT